MFLKRDVSDILVTDLLQAPTVLLAQGLPETLTRFKSILRLFSSTTLRTPTAHNFTRD